MKYVIRKVPERDTSYLERLLPNAEIYNDVDHIGALYSFLDVLKKTDDDALYIQDDMLLCKNFETKAQKIINERPNDVIVFSNFTIDKSSKEVTTQGYWSARKGGWLLCTYIPHEIAQGFLLWWSLGKYQKYDKRWITRQYDDAYFCRFLEEIKKEVFVIIPNLAGHPKNHSVIDGRPPKTTTNFNFDEMEV